MPNGPVAYVTIEGKRYTVLIYDKRKVVPIDILEALAILLRLRVKK